MNTRLIRMIQTAPSPMVTVVGDLILDRYVTGEASRISPEAPIQVLEVDGEHATLGGAANVAVNLRALGARVECCGVVGRDDNGDLLVEKLNDLGIGTGAILRDESRPTICKTRIISHNQQLLRIDKEMRISLDDGLAGGFLESMKQTLEKSDAVVVSDYAKGTLTPPVIGGIMERAGGYGVLVDPKGSDYGNYRGARLVTPNKKEAEDYTGVVINGRDALFKIAQMLREDIGVRDVVVTLGSEGIFYSGESGESAVIAARARSVYDVTGAGDTVIAILAFYLSSDCVLEDAVRIANAGAGIVVGRLGAAAPTRRELEQAFSISAARPSDKILSRPEAAKKAKEFREKGEKLVFTNGCYDLIHGGHLDFLRKAKAFGDALMVAVNDDKSVKRLKGEKRPVLGIEERQEILASMQVVDFVVSFSEDTPLEIIREVTPQILVKGEDWKDKGVVGREWVEEHGGEVELVPLRKGRSTTGIVDKILNLYGVTGHEEV